MTQAAPVLEELGPHLGVLARPPGAERVPGLDRVRLAFVSRIFDAAGAAREFLLAGDPGGAVAALDRYQWREAWRALVTDVVQTVEAEHDRRFADAAARSRMPARHQAAFQVDAETRSAGAARLAAAGIPVEQLLDAWPRDVAAWPAFQARLARTAADCWTSLEEGSLRELVRHEPARRAVADWRPRLAPLLAGGVVACGVALWLGLAIGGVVPLPQALRPLADWWWSLPWP